MPIPSFSDTLGGTLGPGITIIQSGNVFGDEDAVDAGLNLDKMNKELAQSAGGSDIVFMPAEAPKEDMPFKLFLKSLKK